MSFKPRDLVRLKGDPKGYWRVIHAYPDSREAYIEPDGEAWNRYRLVPLADLTLITDLEDF